MWEGDGVGGGGVVVSRWGVEVVIASVVVVVGCFGSVSGVCGYPVIAAFII